jgi:hypothetical protein
VRQAQVSCQQSHGQVSEHNVLKKSDPWRGSKDMWAIACWMSGWNKWVAEGVCQGEAGRAIGPRELGWGSRGAQCHIQRPAGLGLAKCTGLDACVSLLYRFSVGKVESAGYGARVWIVGILLGPGLWYQRSEQKPNYKGLAEHFVVLHPGASVTTRLQVIGQRFVLSWANSSSWFFFQC